MYSDAPGKMISLPVFLGLFLAVALGVTMMVLILRSQLKKTP